jgi:tellurium resistance protein TerD
MFGLLSKGERVDLTKEAPELEKITVGLGWDINSTDTGSDFDLDASVFMLDKNSKLPSTNFFVFYNNKSSEDSSVLHYGDNRTGAGDGDDEVIFVDLAKIDEKITEIVFVVTIHEAEARKQNFGQVANSSIRLMDSGKEVAKYELDEDFSTETALEFGKLYKKNGSWKFQAVGTGYKGGLQTFLDKYQ